jgi:hypothetical protein
MAAGFPIFDNSNGEFSYIDGAQRIEMYLTYEYSGKALTETPRSVKIVLESRSGTARYKNAGTRSLQIAVDGRVIAQAALALDKSTLIGLVTWEQLSYDLLLPKARELIAARSSVTLTLGNIRHEFTRAEVAVFRDFLESLRSGDSTEWRNPQKGCSVFGDIGLTTHTYRYVGMNTYGCYADETPIPLGSGNSISYRAEGNQQSITDLILILRVTNSAASLASHEALARMSAMLAERTIGTGLPDMLLLATITRIPYKWRVGSNTVEVSPTLAGSDGSYEVRFVIKTATP